MAVDRDAWIFGLCFAVVSVIFNISALMEHSSILVWAFAFLLFMLPSGLGFFVGQRIHGENSRLIILFLSAAVASVFSRNLSSLLATTRDNWYVDLLIFFIISALIAWRIPHFNKKNLFKTSTQENKQ